MHNIYNKLFLFFIIIIFFFLTSCESIKKEPIELKPIISETVELINGLAALGPLSGSTVNIYELSQNGTETLKYSTVTTTGTIQNIMTAGKFTIPSTIFKENKFYKILVSGGVDLDHNDDGVGDGPIINNGTVRMIVDSRSILKTGFLNVTLASDIIYSMVENELENFTHQRLLQSINTKSSLILTDNLATIDDMITFNPSVNLNDLNDTFVGNVQERSMNILNGITSTLPENNPPMIDGEVSQTVNEGSTYSFTPIVYDYESDILYASIQGAPNWMHLDVHTGAVSGLPDFDVSTFNQNAQYDISITIRDSKDNSDTFNFSLEVLDINRPPTLDQNEVDLTILFSQPFSQNIDITDLDSEIVNIIRTNSIVPSWLEYSISNNTILISSSGVPSILSNTSIDFIIQDPRGATANLTFNIKIVNDYDSDMDFIPNNIEELIGSDIFVSDENYNGKLDGKDIEGNTGDPLFKYQWHLENLGLIMNASNTAPIYGNDLDLFDVYHKYLGYNNGDPIIVQVVDSGVDHDHEDLIDNIDLSNSYKIANDVLTINDNPSSIDNNSHGTKVAGIIAARAFNGIGLRGIAPFAKVAGANLIESSFTDSNIDTIWTNPNISISNNSWGQYLNGDNLFADIMEKGTQNGRDKKGIIYVVSAGNDREKGGNTGLDNLRGSRFAVVVAALKDDNTYATYSNPGANLLVSAYSGNYPGTSPNIATTTIEGTSKATNWNDNTQNYDNNFNGTSAATPIISGSLALVLEACPDLTWRDVKYLIAKTSIQIDSENYTWIRNSAGLRHSVNYGFGLINTKQIIEECSNGSYLNLSEEINVSSTVVFDSSLQEAENNPLHFQINIDQNITVEYVNVYIDTNHTYATDLTINLISPSGTITQLISPFVSYIDNLHGPSSVKIFGGLIDNKRGRIYKNWLNGGHNFGAINFMKEASAGIWKLQIIDSSMYDTGYLKDVTINIYGHAINTN